MFTLATILSSLCSSNGDMSGKISEFVRKGIQNCKETPASCHNNQFFDTDVTQISPSWFVFSTSTDLKTEVEARNEASCGGPVAPAPGWQGAMHYSEPLTAEEVYEGEHKEGLYIYPDWSACIQGVWEHHLLIEGLVKDDYSVKRYSIGISFQDIIA